MFRQTGKNCILIIDDDFINRELLKNIFSSSFTFEEAANGKEGLEQIQKNADKLCAIILDVEMPEMNGIQVLNVLHEKGVTEKIPMFLITAHDDDELVETAYRYGVMDVVSKPVTAVVIERRVKTVIELFHTREMLSETVKGQQIKLTESEKAIDELHRSTIEALATAIEFRDVESGEHVSRIYGMTKCVLTETAFGNGLSEDEIESIARGAIMHDVGKIAISDVILNKPGRLTAEEFEVMKLHTVRGAELLERISENQTHESYRYAAEIARHHHERYDGRGYPDGLKGDEISIASQVVSIVDVYDALVSARVYKKAFAYDDAVKMIQNNECGVFNPFLVECFLEVEPIIRQWYEDDAHTAFTERDPGEAQAGCTNSRVVAESNSLTTGSVEDVMLLMTAVQTAYDMIISVNLTKNTFHMIDYDRFLTHCVASKGVFDDLIASGAASIPVSHRREFEETFGRESLLRAYHEGKKSVTLEHPQYSDDGVLHWVNTSVMFMEDNRSGDILQITISRYIDEEYQKREKTRKVLSDALNLAEQANTAKADFLSRMSHDIRTPLNAIIGMSTIIAAHLDDKEKIEECLVKIGTSSKFLLGIVNDVLDFSKIESGKLSLNIDDFNLRDLVTEIANQASFLTAGKQQVFEASVDERVGNSYLGDEYRIHQAVMNLIDNAHKYTGIGGKIALKVGVLRKAVDHDVLTFVVEDNGVGIRKEFLENLFEPFAKDDQNEAAKAGVGLGLALTRNLVHLMNGDLGVTSELGQGSCFTLEIPLESGNLTAYSEVIDTDIRVLVVDDEAEVCEHASILLHNMGIAAEAALNGYDAVKLVRANVGTDKEFDVAIVDWKMPELDGIETVKRIREIAGKKVLVVVMSAYDWSEIEEEAREAGVDLFLAKPIFETGLRTAIACSEKIRREKTEIHFDGEKVLVVEDNEFNAEVAKVILEMKNLRVDVCTNGKEAYETFLKSTPGEYSAILMDILMPVMDGLDATRAIRESTHPEGATIPIYAMTANAFHHDILESKLAGMNGHIAKPVDFDEVARVLHAIINHKKPKSFGGGTPSMSFETLKKAGIDIDSFLKRLMGNESLVKIFIKKFCEDTNMEALREAFREKDMKKAEIASHTLKGMCGNLSIEALYTLFTEQVNAIRRGDDTSAEKMMPEIETTFAEVLDGMRAWLNE